MVRNFEAAENYCFVIQGVSVNIYNPLTMFSANHFCKTSQPVNFFFSNSHTTLTSLVADFEEL